MNKISPFDSSSTIVDIARSRAANQPEAAAYVFLDFHPEARATNLTYALLDRSAVKIAAQLRQLANPGDRALLLYQPGFDFICAFFGCLYAGIIAVPLAVPRSGRRADRLSGILEDADPSLVLSTAEVKRSVKVPAVVAGRNWVCTDEVCREEIDVAEDGKALSIGLSSVAYLQYSSGSTGSPKGIMLSHANLVHQSAAISRARRALSSQRSGSSGDATYGVSWLPFSHDMGLVGGILQPMYSGFPCVLMAPESFVENPCRWLQAISDFRAHASPAPNFAYDLCVAKATAEFRSKLDLSSWRFAFTGAEPIRAKTINSFAETFAECGFRREAFFTSYGLAEATLMVSGGNGEREPTTRTFNAADLKQNKVALSKGEEGGGNLLVGCGLPIDDHQVVIVNPETRLVAGSREVGEIWVSGPSVARGYWNKPAETAETFHACLANSSANRPFLRTGDLGFLHGDEVFICGRLKDLILIRGRNHHAPDIELTVENCHRALRASCGAAFPIEVDGEERLVVVQEVDRKVKASEAFEEIIAAIRRGIAEQHEIQVHDVALIRHGSIPKTSSGKIQRRACRALYLDNRLNLCASALSRETAKEPHEGGDSPHLIEQWLLEEIAKLLGCTPSAIDAGKPIKDLNLSDEVMCQLTRQTALHLGTPLPTTLFLDFASIADLSRYLSRTGLIPAKQKDAATASDSTLLRSSNPERIHEPIAVIGIGCRFPGVTGPRSFWQMLCEGVDAITEVPAERWDIDEVYDPNPLAAAKMNSRCGGFISGIDLLDRKFFGLSVREAVRSDPQHRLMLEVSWEALEDAGIAPEQLAGTQTGVFLGISASDYAQMQFGNPAMTDAYAGLGCALTIAASRVSHFLNLRGPAIAVDTACSSSLSAVHLACNSLRQGECTVALAAGVNVLLSPVVTMCLTKAGMMAPDGRCKAFDARANGYVRSEGAGVVVLKPLSRAIADGDSIYSVIRGTASNQDGRSAGISAPNGEAQEAVIRAACKEANVSPGEIDYVEAHGTGTAIGDPIEAKALGTVLATDRAAGRICAIGSVKTNIGHAESAAGIASVIKTSLILKHRQIPASLHFENPNPLIPFESLPIRVQTALGPLPERDHPTLAGVNGFGVGGTNVHLVLEEPPRELVSSDQQHNAAAPRPFLLPLSARSQASLEGGAQALIQMLRQPLTDSDLADICHTSGAGRSHMEHRLAITGRTAADLADALAAHLDQGRHAAVAAGTVPTHLTAPPKLVFAFSGQGSQWPGMGCCLLKREAVFRRVIEECDALFRPYTGWSLIDNLTAPPSSSRLDHTEVAQPALFAVQAGLAELLRSWGVVCDAVVGHSAGEIAAAYVAGALDLTSAAKLVTNRSRLMQQATGGGKMASIELSWDELEPLLNGWRDNLSVAAVNGPNSIVLSGEAPALDHLVETLHTRGVVAVPLPVNYAFHSQQMEGPKGQLVDLLRKDFAPSRAQTPMFSTVTGRWVGDQPLDADYWGANVRQPVLLAAAIEGLARGGAQIFLEIGPQPVISGAISRNLKFLATRGAVIPSLKRDEDEQQALLSAVAKLYAEGRPANWSALYPGARKSHFLPTYQWDRQRFWLNVPDQGKRRKAVVHPLLGQRQYVAQPVWQSTLDQQAQGWIKDLRMQSRTVLPSGLFAETALAAAAELYDGAPFDLSGLRFQQGTELPGGDATPVVQTSVSQEDNGESTIRIFTQPTAGPEESNWPLHLTVRATSRSDAPTKSKSLDLAEIQHRCHEQLEGTAFYRKLEEIGTHYGPTLRSVDHIWKGERCALARIRVPDTLTANLKAFRLHPVIFEAVSLACRAAHGPFGLQLDLTSCEHIRMIQPTKECLYAYSRLRPTADAGHDLARADVWISDEAGEIVALLAGVEFKTRQQPVRVSMDPEQWLYDIVWEPLARTSATSTAFQGQGNWLVFADHTGIGERLGDLLRLQGERCVLVQHGPAYERLAPESFVARHEPEDLRRLLKEALPAQSNVWRGMVHLWSIDSLPAQSSTAQSIAVDQGLGVVSIIHLIQAIAGADLPRAPRLWAVTRGAQQVGQDRELASVSQSTIWGLGKVMAIEHPELRSCRIDLDAASPVDALSLFEECWANDREDQIALRGEQRYVARLIHHKLDHDQSETIDSAQANDTTSGDESSQTLTIPQDRPFRIELTVPDRPESSLVTQSARSVPGPSQVEICVSAASLDARDLRHTQIGAVAAGTVVERGIGILNLQPGDEVIALAPGCTARYITVNASAVFTRPSGIAPDEAVGSMRPFLVAYYALRELARLAPRERILVHGADTALGLAATQVAKSLGASVFATVAKPECLEGTGVDHVLESGSLSFVGEILDLTGGSGVDLVLNCLTNANLAQFLPTLTSLGRLIDVARNESPGVRDGQQLCFRDNLAIHAVDIDQLASSRPEYLNALGREVISHFASGAFRALPVHTLPIARTADALRAIASSDRPTTVAVSLPPVRSASAPLFHRDATYLITGGLGGLGLSIAKRIVEHGGRHLVLAGRRAPSAEAEAILAQLRSLGAEPWAVSLDVSDEQQVSDLLAKVSDRLPPLRGIIHAAGLLDNGLLAQLDEARIRSVMHSKITGAWHLHKLTAGSQLDFFVLFSSLASLIGSPGQGNYAAANAFLDALAVHRTASGLPALSIAWGPWAEVGMAADAHNAARLEEVGMGMLPPEKALDLFELLIQDAQGAVGAIAMNWQLWREAFPLAGDASFVSRLVPARRARGQGEMVTAEALRTLETDARLRLIEETIHRVVCQALQVEAASLPNDVSLTAAGLDSIVAIELKNRIESAIEVVVQAPQLLRGPTIHELACQLSTLVVSESNLPAEVDTSGSGNIATPTPEGEKAEKLLGDLDQLSDDEVNALLLTIGQQQGASAAGA